MLEPKSGKEVRGIAKDVLLTGAATSSKIKTTWSTEDT
jgi:hypothetical protein